MKPVDLSQLLTSVMGNFEPLFQTDQKDLQGNLETVTSSAVTATASIRYSSIW